MLWMNVILNFKKNFFSLLFKERVRNTTIYFFFSILQKGFSFILIPIYTNFLTPDQYGIIATISIFSTIITLIYFLSIHESAYFSVLKNDNDVNIKISSILYFEIFLIFIVIVITIFSYLLFGNFVLFGINYYPIIFFTILSALLSSTANTFLLIQKAKERIILYSVFSFVNFLITTGILLVLLIKYRLEAMSYVYSQLIANGITFLITIVWLFKAYGTGFSFIKIKSSISFSAPLILHNSAHYIRSGIEKVFLSTFVSLNSTGIYNIAYSIGSLFQFALEAFVSTNNPRFFSLIRDKRNEQKIVAMLPLSTGIFTIVALVLSVFGKELIQLFISNDRYYTAYLYLPIILSSFVFFLIYLNIVNVLFYKTNTKLIASITLSVSFFSLFAGFILIKYLGIWGAAFWVLVSNILMALVVYIFCQKQMPLKWKLYKACFFSILPTISYLFEFLNIEHFIYKLLLCFSLILLVISLIINDLKKITSANEL
jgi:O-antigen/teichoic acid export membrane protein